MRRRAWRPRLLHAAALAAGLAVFGLVFIYTGDSDLLFAMVGGLGSGLVVYLGGQFHSGMRADVE